MSRGHWDFQDQILCESVLGYRPNFIDSDEAKMRRKLIVKNKPLIDPWFSEQIYDMFCVLYALDNYASGDGGIECVNKALAYYKDKWQAKPMEKFDIQKLVEEKVDEKKADIVKEILANFSHVEYTDDDEVLYGR